MYSISQVYLNMCENVKTGEFATEEVFKYSKV